MWQYTETSEFVKCAEDISLSEKTRDSLKSWAPGVRRMPTPRNKIFFRSPKNTFEIWIARIANPDVNRGKSGGFRLVYILNIPENLIYMDQITFRQDLGSKNEHPRDQQKEKHYLDSLKKKLLKEIDGL